jgi:hypothetical protein
MGVYTYLKADNVANVNMGATVLRAVGFAALGGILGFGAGIAIIAKLGLSSVMQGVEPDPVPKNPWRIAALVGLAAAGGFSALISADQRPQFDRKAFAASVAGALLALGIAWCGGFILRRARGAVSVDEEQQSPPK